MTRHGAGASQPQDSLKDLTGFSVGTAFRRGNKSTSVSVCQGFLPPFPARQFQSCYGTPQRILIALDQIPRGVRLARCPQRTKKRHSSLLSCTPALPHIGSRLPGAAGGGGGGGSSAGRNRGERSGLAPAPRPLRPRALQWVATEQFPLLPVSTSRSLGAPPRPTPFCRPYSRLAVSLRVPSRVTMLAGQPAAVEGLSAPPLHRSPEEVCWVSGCLLLPVCCNGA